MKINSHLLSFDELKKYLPNLNENDLTDLIYATFLQQKEKWGMLREGWKGFQFSEFRKYYFGWFCIKTQFNPTRFVSSSAKVDEESIKNRKCFLCLENLPEDQKGVLFEDELIILCNPAPIFNEHFTISHLEHTPQRIYKNIEKMLRLSELCNNKYTIFYNGPRCGASAPDHFHFQACPSNELLSEKDIINNLDKFPLLKENKNIKIHRSENYLRNVLILISKDIQAISDEFRLIYGYLQNLNSNYNEEPMMNLFSLKRGEDFYLVLFPREKHRPSFYFLEGEENMLVSPGLVDMSGIIITPLQKDFERINHNIIRQIYTEVSYNSEKFKELVNEISSV